MTTSSEPGATVQVAPGSTPLVDLTGKVALITGAAGGQGAAEGRLFARLGAKVVLGDVQEEQVRARAAEIGDAAVALPLDVGDPEQWRRAVAAAVDHFGQLDVLVNNAGLHRQRMLADLPVEELQAILRVNLVGPILGMQAVLPVMRGRGGSVINVSSTAGVQAIADRIAYTSSKWGLRGASRSAALQLGHDGIRVNCICPGAIDTDMASDQVRRGEGPVLLQPIPRIGRTDEVAQLAAFLASDASSYCTGADFVIDGGATA